MPRNIPSTRLFDPGTLPAVAGGPDAAHDGTLIVTVDGDGPVDILERYWAGRIDESGRAVFDESVAVIADAYGVQPSEVTRLARSAGYAQRPDWRCPSCGRLWVLRTRSEPRPQGSWSRCDTCRAADAEAVRVRQLEEDERQAHRRRLIEATYLRGEATGEVWAALPELAGVAFADLIAFYTWLLHTGPDGVLLPGRFHDLVLFSGDDTEGRLFRAGLTCIDPTTPTTAFNWNEGDGELPPRYWPSLARFHVGGSGPLDERAADALVQVEGLLDGAWPNEWVAEAVVEVRSTLAAEAVRYLANQVERHQLPAPDLDQRTKLLVSVDDAMTTYSLGQCYTLLWRSAKDGAAAKARHPMTPADAVSHAVNQFGTNVERSRAGKHDLHEYQQPRDLPFAAQAEVLCSRVFGVSPMTVRLSDIEGAARGRLSDDETVARFIAEGMPDRRAAAALKRLDDLPAYGDGVDPLVESIRAVARRVGERGGSKSDAIRTAYFSLSLLEDTGPYSAFEIEECRIAIVDAVRGDGAG